MFGQCLHEGTFPAPASHEERRSWINRGNRVDAAGESSEDGKGGNGHINDDEAPAGHDHLDIDGSAMELDDDPCFPYPNGPGHPRASPEALKIIWHEMCKNQVKSFRLNLNDAMSTPTNQFLWNLAIQTFYKLIRAGEYESLTLDLCSKEKVNRAFSTHITGHLLRE
jgi:hypothetical protein